MAVQYNMISGKTQREESQSSDQTMNWWTHKGTPTSPLRASDGVVVALEIACRNDKLRCR